MRNKFCKYSVRSNSNLKVLSAPKKPYKMFTNIVREVDIIFKCFVSTFKYLQVKKIIKMIVF